MPVYYEEVKAMIEREINEREAHGATLDLDNKFNLIKLFRDTVRKSPDQPALKTRVEKADGTVVWKSKTYREFADMAEQIAAVLLDLGIKEGDMVNLQSHTREEWAIIDEGILGIGAVVVCNYPSLAPNVVEYQLNDSKSVVAFVEEKHHIETLIELKDKVPTLKWGIAIDDPREEDPDYELPDWFMTFDEVIEKGKKLLEKDPSLKEKILGFEQSVDPESLATIIYTSGTTGMPKGAMLTHWNLVSDCLMVRWFAPLDLAGKSNLSFLPLSHSLERLSGHFYPIMIGMCTAFASNIDNLSRDLKEVQPEYLTGVPRVFEKIYAYAMLMIKDYSSIKKKIFWWAVNTGKEFDKYFRESKGEGIPFWTNFKIKIARKLVFDKFLQATGGKLLFFISGGASLPDELAKFYGAVGITIIEGYGLTETSPVTNMNDPLAVKYGTVGPPITGTEEKIAEDGEILIKGPQVFKGYLNKPEQTKAVLEDDGWFHTGDLGEFDEAGNLKIIGRKKEIFVLSTGKKVPPILIEDLVAMAQFIQQLVLIGDGRKFISAILTPAFDYLEGHVKKTMPDAAKEMPNFATASKEEVEKFLEKPEIIDLFQKDIDHINSQVDPFMQIKRFVIVPNEMTEESGDLTPSLKFKRRNISENYRDKIEALYEKDISVELSDEGVQITQEFDE